MADRDDSGLSVSAHNVRAEEAETSVTGKAGVKPEVEISKNGVDKDSTYQSVYCVSCNEVLGRQYLASSPQLDSLRGKFTLFAEKLISYEFGSAENGGNNEMADLLSVPDPRFMQQQISKIHIVIVSMNERIKALEKALQLDTVEVQEKADSIQGGRNGAEESESVSSSEPASGDNDLMCPLRNGQMLNAMRRNLSREREAQYQKDNDTNYMDKDGHVLRQENTNDQMIDERVMDRFQSSQQNRMEARNTYEYKMKSTPKNRLSSQYTHNGTLKRKEQNLEQVVDNGTSMDLRQQTKMNSSGGNRQTKMNSSGGNRQIKMNSPGGHRQQTQMNSPGGNRQQSNMNSPIGNRQTHYTRNGLPDNVSHISMMSVADRSEIDEDDSHISESSLMEQWPNMGQKGRSVKKRKLTNS